MRILTSFSLWFLLIGISWAGVLFDDFKAPRLAEDIWWVKTTGKAKAEIRDGTLVLSSFDVPDSIFLFYREPIGKGEPITVEVRIDVNTNPNDGWLGFFQDFPGKSHNNSIINAMKNVGTMFFVEGGGKSVQPRGEDGKRAALLPLDEGFHIFKIEVTKNEYRMFMDGKEVLSGNRNDEGYIKRVFYITPDGFDNFYGNATYTVDWVKLSGPGLPDRTVGADVSPRPALAVTWGEIKTR